jgi:aconitate hydratase
LIKLGDHITTDHIMPSNAKLLPYRSNIPYLAEYCLTPCDPDFPKRAQENSGGIIAAGENYGQGSSREHAALAPLYLGIKAVVAKSFARIHRANLINAGIVPLTFVDEADYDQIQELDQLEIENIKDQLRAGNEVIVKNITRSCDYRVKCELSERELAVLLMGGKINWIKQRQ